MVSTKRSSRLAARKSKPKYNDDESTGEEGEHSKRIIGSDDDDDDDDDDDVDLGESSDFSVEIDGDDKEEEETRFQGKKTKGASTPERKWPMTDPSSSNKPSRKSIKQKARRQSRAKDGGDGREKTEISLSTDDDGSDHAEEDDEDRKRPVTASSEGAGKRSRSDSEASRLPKRSRLPGPLRGGGNENGQTASRPLPPPQEKSRPPPQDRMGRGSASRDDPPRRLPTPKKDSSDGGGGRGGGGGASRPSKGAESGTRRARAPSANAGGAADTDAPPTSRKSDAPKDWREKVGISAAGTVNKKGDSGTPTLADESKDSSPRKKTDEERRAASTKRAQERVVRKDSKSSSAGIEKGIRPKDSTAKAPSKINKGVSNESIRPKNKRESEGVRLDNKASKKRAESAESHNRGGNDKKRQSSDGQSSDGALANLTKHKMDGQDKRDPNKHASRAKIEDTDKFKRKNGPLSKVSIPTPKDKRESPARNVMPASNKKTKESTPLSHLRGGAVVPRGSLEKRRDAKVRDDGQSSAASITAGRNTGSGKSSDKKEGTKGRDGTTSAASTVARNPGSNSSLGEKLNKAAVTSAVYTNETKKRRVVTEEEIIPNHPIIGQTSKKDITCHSMSSSALQMGNSRGSSIIPQRVPSGPISMSIQYPKQRQKTTSSPSVGQLKMALFLEASDAHRGNRPERMFARYWETLEKYVAGNSGGAIIKSGNTGADAMLRGFLKTRKMKRLHNKLVLGIMMDSVKIDLPISCSSHVPEKWKTAMKKIQPKRPNQGNISVDADVSDAKSDQLQWNKAFGPRSGAWTVCGEEFSITKTDIGRTIRPKLVGSRSVHKGGFEEEPVLPSARLPGALEIEPLVRKNVESSGLTASENAIWMLVVAVREHSASVIKKVIANDKDFNDGYAPSLPAHVQTSLSHPQAAPENGIGVNKGSRGNNNLQKSGKKVINSTSLLHVLDETPSIASRLASIRSSVTSDDRGISSTFCHGLDDVNCIINASIQRGARKREKSSYTEKREKSFYTEKKKKVVSRASTSRATSVTPVHANVGLKTQSDGHLSKAQPSSTQSLPTPPSLPLNQPQLAAQRRNQPPHTLHPPKSQSGPPSMPSQNTQPRRNSSQLMNHSDHTRANKPFEQQQTMPISNTDIPTLEPLTKPGFPSLTNAPQKPGPSPKNSAPTTKTTSSPAPAPAPRAVKRGSKNLAAMMARPSSQPKPASDKATSDEKNANGAARTVTKPGGETKPQDDGAKDKKDNTKETKAPAAASSSRSGGRGFGVKNLARMKARASLTEK